MLARLQNQLKNNADIGAVCAGAGGAYDGGIEQNISVKNPNSHWDLQ